MSGSDNKDILRRIKQIGAIRPEPQATEQAIERIRRALLAPSRRRWSRRFKILVPTAGIAAALLVALGLLLMTVLPQSARADDRELLREILNINAAYKNWIHLTSERNKQWDGINIRSNVIHVNTTTDTSICWLDYTDHVRIRWSSPELRCIYEYVEQTNTLYIFTAGPRHPKNDRPSIHIGLPVQPTADEMFAHFDEIAGKEGYKVERTMDGPYERFDIILLKDKLDKYGGLQNMQDRTTFWVDPKTKLFHRWQASYKDTDQTGAYTFTYGEPTITSVYDLGVPRDVKIIDERPSDETIQLLDYLSSRVGLDENLGNYVAVVTRTQCHADGPREPAGLEIFSRQDDRRLYANYQDLVDLKFSGWPSPDIDGVLARTKQALPFIYFSSDGTTGHIRRRNWSSTTYNWKVNVTEESLGDSTALWSLSGQLRMGHHMVGYHHLPFSDLRMSLRRDPVEHPELIGLYVDVDKVFRYRKDRTLSRYDTFYWLDPAREYVTTERISRSYGPDGKLTDERRRHLLECFEPIEGYYLPSVWRDERIDHTQDPPKTRVDEYRLLFFPNKRLDESWFVPPEDQDDSKK